MPVEFLTDEQAAAYGSFREMPTRPELERFFFLDDDDRDLIALRRSDGHRLGMALQVCTVRYLGLFLKDPLDVPWPVVEYLAAQMGITDASCVKRYVERPKTAYEHSWEIRRRFGYHEFEDWAWGRKFRTFLYGRAWTHPGHRVQVPKNQRIWAVVPGHVRGPRVLGCRRGCSRRRSWGSCAVSRRSLVMSSSDSSR